MARTAPFPSRTLRLLGALAAAAGLLAACAGSAEPAEPDVPEDAVSWVRIEGPLDTGALSLLRRGVAAAKDGAGTLVIELDSPGGRVDLMWRIAAAVESAADSGVYTVAWINRQAVSAGALLALSCENVYIRAQGSFGSATAVQMGPGGLVEMGEHERAKWNSALRADFRGKAQAHGRPGVLADAMVDKEVEVKLVRVDGEPRLVDAVEYEDLQARGEAVVLERTVCARGELLNLTGTEAVQYDMADGLAEDADELLEKIGLADRPVARLERTRSEDLAALLSQVSGLLLTAALILGFMELKAPGFGVPGVLSLLCLGAFLFGRYLVGLADIPHIVLVVLGSIAIAVEIFFLPGFLWTGILGGLMVLAGLVLSFLGPGFDTEYTFGRQLLLDSAYRMGWSVVLALVGAWALSRYLPNTPLLGRLVLRTGEGDGMPAASANAPVAPRARPGALGRAATDLRPVGKVFLDDVPTSDFEARALGVALDAGTRVRVVEVRSGRLVVEAAPAEGPHGESGGDQEAGRP